jgi:very-short-patch-repair endonuclease
LKNDFAPPPLEGGGQGVGEAAMKPRHSLQGCARELRNNATDVERLLWRRVRNSQLEGVKFRRQQPIETYIVDFISFEKKIVIELDGGQHAESSEYDEQRSACMRANGFTVVRFWNNDVLENIEGVLEIIRQQCLK